MLKTVLKGVANSAVGLKLRHVLGMPVPEYLPRLHESVSDLFLWRSDKVWETRFDLLHMAGMINPAFTRPYPVLIHLYDQEGVLLDQQQREVSSGEVQRLNLEEMLGPRKGFGSFALFHLVDPTDLFGENKTCLAERGYTSFRRKTDPSPLWSYVHGNLFVLGCDKKSLKVRNLGRLISEPYFYRPQLSFEECSYFELFITNPTSQPLEMTLEWMDSQKVVSRVAHSLPVKGTSFFSSPKGPQKIHAVHITSRFPMLRPLIFKFYATHFDVLHG